MWAIALAASLLGNVVIFILAGLASIESEKFRNKRDPAASPPPPKEASVLISPDMIQKIPGTPAVPAPGTPPPARLPDAVRTSEDQRGKRPDRPLFIGERDTEATSDQTPDPTAKPMPSQRGVVPRSETDIETTESKYQDGTLNDSQKATAAAAQSPSSPPTPPPAPNADPAMAPKEAPAPAEQQPPPADPAMKPNAETAAPAVPEPEKLLQGPNPVDVPVAKAAPEKIAQTAPPSPPAEKSVKAAPDQTPPTPPKPPTPKPGEPGFRGNQRKTAIRGSISRTGRSALDVADSPLGRYQAVISRAVEQEWQRNCVRHRDFITPGFLTVRFFVTSSGKVKSVQFVGEMETGEVQKGFTLNSIRDAEIPAMPKELRAEYGDEALELIFNFYF